MGIYHRFDLVETFGWPSRTKLRLRLWLMLIRCINKYASGKPSHMRKQDTLSSCAPQLSNASFLFCFLRFRLKKKKKCSHPSMWVMKHENWRLCTRWASVSPFHPLIHLAQYQCCSPSRTPTYPYISIVASLWGDDWLLLPDFYRRWAISKQKMLSQLAAKRSTKQQCLPLLLLIDWRLVFTSESMFVLHKKINPDA